VQEGRFFSPPALIRNLYFLSLAERVAEVIEANPKAKVYAKSLKKADTTEKTASANAITAVHTRLFNFIGLTLSLLGSSSTYQASRGVSSDHSSPVDSLSSSSVGNA
jgi:hypothetical protein